jgi:hypothetical protein
VFGVFITESWHKSSQHFGNGESMVMSLLPTFHVYRWTEANSYFAIGKSDFIAVGGGYEAESIPNFLDFPPHFLS